jgi:hypothetical protein
MLSVEAKDELPWRMCKKSYVTKLGRSDMGTRRSVDDTTPTEAAGFQTFNRKRIDGWALRSECVSKRTVNEPRTFGRGEATTRSRHSYVNLRYKSALSHIITLSLPHFLSNTIMMR